MKNLFNPNNLQTRWLQSLAFGIKHSTLHYVGVNC
jgi:hypothetical protein